MRLRHIKGAEDMIAANRFVIQDMQNMRGKHSHPLHIEVGTGKGRFITTLAKLHPDITYIGIENHSSVLLRAVQKLEEEDIPNLRFMLLDAAFIEDVFAPGEVDKIYLNFSDPWPKDRHAKRRLPSRNFLSLYEKVLKPEGCVEFKTDNKGLFDFAMEELAPARWETEYVSYDLHADDKAMKDNIMTEYEEKFSALGNPIYKYIIKKNKH